MKGNRRISSAVSTHAQADLVADFSPKREVQLGSDDVIYSTPIEWPTTHVWVQPDKDVYFGFSQKTPDNVWEDVIALEEYSTAFGTGSWLKGTGVYTPSFMGIVTSSDIEGFTENLKLTFASTNDRMSTTDPIALKKNQIYRVTFLGNGTGVSEVAIGDYFQVVWYAGDATSPSTGTVGTYYTVSGSQQTAVPIITSNLTHRYEYLFTPSVDANAYLHITSTTSATGATASVHIQDFRIEQVKDGMFHIDFEEPNWSWAPNLYGDNLVPIRVPWGASHVDHQDDLWMVFKRKLSGAFTKVRIVHA